MSDTNPDEIEIGLLLQQYKAPAGGRDIYLIKQRPSQLIKPDVVSMRASTPVVKQVTKANSLIPGIKTSLPCLFGVEPWCWAPEFFDPTIVFNITPFEFSQVDFYPWKLKITGRVTNKFANISREAEKLSRNLKNGAEKARETIAGSADLTGEFLQSLGFPEANNNLTAISSHFVPTVGPGNEIPTDGSWELSGPLSFLKAVFGVITRDKVYTRGGLDLNMSYPWKGTQSLSQHLDMEVWLPVGDVNIHANPFDG